MKKEIFERAEMEVIEFTSEDVIMTSNAMLSWYEGDRVFGEEQGNNSFSIFG